MGIHKQEPPAGDVWLVVILLEEHPLKNTRALQAIRGKKPGYPPRSTTESRWTLTAAFRRRIRLPEHVHWETWRGIQKCDSKPRRYPAPFVSKESGAASKANEPCSNYRRAAIIKSQRR